MVTSIVADFFYIYIQPTILSNRTRDPTYIYTCVYKYIFPFSLFLLSTFDGTNTRIEVAETIKKKEETRF